MRNHKNWARAGGLSTLKDVRKKQEALARCHVVHHCIKVNLLPLCSLADEPVLSLRAACVKFSLNQRRQTSPPAGTAQHWRALPWVAQGGVKGQPNED